MPLFHPRAVKKLLDSLPAALIPQVHLEPIRDWADAITSGRIYKENETNLDAVFISRILVGVLGYSDFSRDATCTLKKNHPIGTGNVDVALGSFSGSTSQVIAPFELKGANTRNLDAIMPGRNKSPVQQAWEYAMDAPGAKWVLVTNYLEVRLYAVGYGRDAYERFDLATLTNPIEYRRFMRFLSAEHLLGGGTFALLKESDAVGKEITNRLYLDYRSIRERLILSLKADNSSLAELEIISHAQTILDRILFIAFAEDRSLLPEHTLAMAFKHVDPFNPKPVWENFKGLFRAIDAGSELLRIPAYNGGLFRQNLALDSLKVNDHLCEGFKLLGDYDFNTEIGVTVLGHIFEQSITDIEALQALAQGEQPVEAKGRTTGKRKREGVVYTPDTITAFIVEQALGGYLKQQFARLFEAHKSGRKKSGEWRNAKAETAFWLDYQEALKQVKVIDPACGSGAFLVAAFDYLYAEYARVNERLTSLRGGERSLFDLDKEILTSNLYGVDINHESIEITKLSLWLKSARRGKVLNSLDHNLRVGDSIVADSVYSERAFDWDLAFPEVTAAGGFDVVLGNPPYVHMGRLKHIKPYLEEHYDVSADRADLYSYFFEVGLRRLKDGGRLGYISSNTYFKTGSGRPLRIHLQTRASLDCVVDFGDLQVFEGVTTYPAIVILEKGLAPDGHALRFLKLEELVDTDIEAAVVAGGMDMPQAELSADGWDFEVGSLTALRRKIRDGRKTLKEVYGPPLYGIKTGCNDAFVIDRPTRDRLIAQDPNAAALLHPFLEGKDIKPWHLESRDRYIIYIPKNSIDVEEFPSIRDHLLPHKDALEKRATKQRWFELQQAQLAYMPAFKGPKIIYAHFSPEPLFSHDSNGYLSNDKSYIIPNGDFFLLGLLNSRVLWSVATSLCPPVQGGYYEVRVQYMETLPIPEATDVERATIASVAEQIQQLCEDRYLIQSTVRHRIMDLAPASTSYKLNKKLLEWWKLSFGEFRSQIKSALKAEIPLRERGEWESYLADQREQLSQLSQQIRKLDGELNDSIYPLFDLDRDEIKLLAPQQA